MHIAAQAHCIVEALCTTTVCVVAEEEHYTAIGQEGKVGAHCVKQTEPTTANQCTFT